MQSRTRNSAYILLLSFIVGGLVAPLSHYAFMALSDVYMDFGQAGHAGSMHASHVQDDASGPAFDVIPAHIVCEYSDLFATFASTTIDNHFEPVDRPVLSVYRVQMETISLSETPQDIHLRGPPSNVS